MTEINFDSDKIVIIYHKGGASGELINRLLYFSPEVIPPTTEWINTLDDLFTFNFEHAGTSVDVGNCHGSDQLWIDHGTRDCVFPYNHVDVSQAREFIEKNAHDIYRVNLVKNEKYLFFRSHEIGLPQKIFPNSKLIYIDKDDKFGEYFFMRSMYEKILKPSHPIHTRKKIHKDIRKNKKICDISKGKDLNMECYDDIQGDKFRLSLIKILSCDRAEYHRLCNYLNITPSPRFEELVVAYMDVQWKRKRAGI